MSNCVMMQPYSFELRLAEIVWLTFNIMKDNFPDRMKMVVT